MAHYDLLLGNGCLSGLGPCLVAFLLVAHYDLLLGNGCLSGLGPCLVAFSFHFGLVGLHFLAFWPFRPSFPCILALWAFISLHFGLVGLHFLAFWPCGPSFPFILAVSGSASGPPPTSCQKWPVCPTSLQWNYQRRDRLHFAVFSILGLHFLAFWSCGPSFPCILALWAFISLHFGLVGLHFLAFWPYGPSFPFILAFSGSASGAPPGSMFNSISSCGTLRFAPWCLSGLGPCLVAFWPCRPSFPCILALWAFISCHFGLLGLHFLSFWPCGPSFPFILALWAFISFHFGFFGVSVWVPPHKLPKIARLPNVLTMDLSAP